MLPVDERQWFYISKKENCITDGVDAVAQETAAPYYIISTWISAQNHYRLKKDFQLTDGWFLPKRRCVRLSGPLSGELVQVSVKILHEHSDPTIEVGYVNTSDLEDFNHGFFAISDCRSELWRWLFSCNVGYVNSYFVIDTSEITKRHT